MFTDDSTDTVEFISSWKRERSLTENSVQTVDLKVYDVACQSVKRRDAECQTDADDRDVEFMRDNSRELTHFLQKVCPYVLKQLERNLTSKAFEGYGTSIEEEKSTVTCTHTLSHAVLEEKLPVSGLSWNSTGSVLAVSYGRFDHEDWCTHKSAVGTWNLDRRKLDVNKPDTSVDSPCCVTCVEFHPCNPALLAGGNFNGEVLVWDLSKEDDLLLASSGIGDDSHREPVSKLRWIPDPTTRKKKFNLVSVSADGKILIWKMDSKKSQTLKLIDGFVLMTQSLPRSMKVRGVRSDKEMGVTCISYNSVDSDTFLIGSECGGIFKCSMQAQGNPAGSHLISSVPLRSPVTFTYSPHHGPVYSVQCSLFHRNAFLSSAMDQCLRVYTILQAQPIMTIEPGLGYLYSAKWSPVRPTVLAATTESGHLLVYDLKQSQPLPVYKLEASTKKAPVYSLEFNSSQPGLLATGDGCGFVRVFELADDLTKLTNRETDILDKLVSPTSE